MAGENEGLIKTRKILAVLGLIIVCETTAADPETLRNQAKLLYQEGKMEQALDLFEQLEAIEPSPELAKFLEKLRDYVNTSRPDPVLLPETGESLLDKDAETEGQITEEQELEEAGQKEGVPVPVGLKPKSLGLTMGFSFLPGAGHFYLGRKIKGTVIAVATSGLYLVSLLTLSQSKKKLGEYEALGPGTSEFQFDSVYAEYDRFRVQGNTFLVMAGAAHLMGILDAYWEHTVIEIKIKNQELVLAAKIKF